MAEIGYSDFRRGASVSPVYEASYRHEHTPTFQADAVVRTLALLLATEKVELAAWYRINDLPETQDIIGDVNNRRLGVRTVTGCDKPATATPRMAAVLLGTASEPTEGLRVLESLGPYGCAGAWFRCSGRPSGSGGVAADVCARAAKADERRDAR